MPSLAYSKKPSRSPKTAVMEVSAPTTSEVSTESRPQPSWNDIAVRAYELYMDSGYEDGHDLDHWLKAEQELRAL